MTGKPDKYQTVAAATKAEYVVQRSRFIGCAMPAITRDDCRAFIDSISVKHPKANHCCWAYKTGYPDAAEEYYSDAGEPSGTAGSPILSAISHAELQNVVVVVIRYFGGIKLGTGGMARAYALAIKEVLNVSTLLPYEKQVEYAFETSYSNIDKTLHKLKQLGITQYERDFGMDSVKWIVVGSEEGIVKLKEV